MGVRMVEGDFHYGHLGLGSLIASAADTFSATIIDPAIEPDLIVTLAKGKSILEVEIDDVLLWDSRKIKYQSTNAPDRAAGGDTTQFDRAGITVDNTVNGNDAPTADTVAQGTRPSGGGVGVTGAAAGGPGTPTNIGEQGLRYWDSVEFWATSNETVDATGQANHGFNQFAETEFSPYTPDSDIVCHKLWTGAHYHAWTASTATGNSTTLDFGIDCRKMSVDVNELLFDRGVLLSLIEALSAFTP